MTQETCIDCKAPIGADEEMQHTRHGKRHARYSVCLRYAIARAEAAERRVQELEAQLAATGERQP